MIYYLPVARVIAREAHAVWRLITAGWRCLLSAMWLCSNSLWYGMTALSKSELGEFGCVWISWGWLGLHGVLDESLAHLLLSVRGKLLDICAVSSGVGGGVGFCVSWCGPVLRLLGAIS